MVALPPSVTRLRRTSGVRPILKELSSKTLNSDLPVQNETILFVGPAVKQIRERGLIHDAGNGLIHLPPHIGERCFALAPRAMLALLRPLDESQNFPYRSEEHTSELQ